MNELKDEYICLNNYKALLKEFDRVIELNGNSQYAKYTLTIARSIVEAFTSQAQQELDDHISMTSDIVEIPASTPDAI